MQNSKTPNAQLIIAFSGTEDEGAVFIDRDPDTFKEVLSFLRTGRDGFLKTNFNCCSGLCRHKNWFADLNRYVSVSQYNI